MGKYLLVASFLLTLALAVYVFLSRDDRSLREQVVQQAGRPRLTMEEFTVYRYRDHRVLSTLSAKMGQFLEPNILEIYGDIRGMRHDSEKREFVNAEGSSTQFRSRGVIQLMKEPDIIKTELENDVQFGFDETMVFTQFTEYLAEPGVLRSDVPVLVRSPQGFMHSQTGFNYDIEEELMELYGPLQGTLQQSEKVQLP
ncbi:MAG: hypothetical protein ACOH5I_05915 [Oligoflexus sp.]